MTELKRYSVGEKITGWPAHSWNEICDRVSEPRFDPSGETDQQLPGIIGVRNMSTTLIPKGGVAMPTGSAMTMSNGDLTANFLPVLTVDEPDLSEGAEDTYLIASGPIGATGSAVSNSGGAVQSGYVFARVNIRDETDLFAQVIDGDATKLESTAIAARARIIDKESGTGEKWALIFLRPAHMRWFKGIAKAPIPADGSEEAHVYLDAATDTEEDQVTYLDWVHGTENISQDLRITAMRMESANHFEVVQANCEPVAESAPGAGEGITASTTQSQGEEPLTERVNNVTTVANANDVVTMPSVAKGDDCFVMNNGANTLQIYPASGDNFDGSAIDVSVTLAAGSSVHYFGNNSTMWLS